MVCLVILVFSVVLSALDSNILSCQPVNTMAFVSREVSKKILSVEQSEGVGARYAFVAAAWMPAESYAFQFKVSMSIFFKGTAKHRATGATKF